MIEAEVVELLDSDDEDVATPAARQAAPASLAAAAHEEAGPSEPEPNDGSVAQLVDMGFTPEQAATVRSFHRQIRKNTQFLSHRKHSG